MSLSWLKLKYHLVLLKRLSEVRCLTRRMSPAPPALSNQDRELRGEAVLSNRDAPVQLLELVVTADATKPAEWSKTLEVKKEVQL